MSNEKRFGGVSARVNEDGTLFLYQPDSNRLLSAELAQRLCDWLAESLGLKLTLPLDTVLTFNSNTIYPQAVQDTVPAGVLNTSEGVVTPEEAAAELTAQLQHDGADHGPVPEPPALTETEREADKNAEEARDRVTVQTPENPSLKQLREVAQAFGISPAGSKAQIIARLKKGGLDGGGISGPGLD